MTQTTKIKLSQPLAPGTKALYSDAHAAVERIAEIYEINTRTLRDAFVSFAHGAPLAEKVRACYPYIRISTRSLNRGDTRLSYGFVPGPGTYEATLTRPELYRDYYLEHVQRLMTNHNEPVEVGVSDTPIPLHFSWTEQVHLEGDLDHGNLARLPEFFDLPDLNGIDDAIADGLLDGSEPFPLALFNAQRVDYSLQRLRHYTATSANDFQNFVLFTNYQFYVDQFVALSVEMMQETDDPAEKERRSEYTSFVQPGGYRIYNRNVFPDKEPDGEHATRLPQMPAYHLQRADGSGITLINIGVGPSNAKTITDHVAVTRPHAWVMLGHCAGLRNTQKLGDYVLAHGYVREDHVLDDALPPQVPLPALAEVQLALAGGVSEVMGLKGYALKSVMRTGTVVTTDDRNWELRDYRQPLSWINRSRAIALDMESATIAANGFRFRVPYGTLLCVSDKPLHGQLKLPAMADSFYRERVNQHLEIGIRAMELLRLNGAEQLHSRKLRSFQEVAFR